MVLSAPTLLIASGVAFVLLLGMVLALKAVGRAIALICALALSALMIQQAMIGYTVQNRLIVTKGLASGAFFGSFAWVLVLQLLADVHRSPAHPST